MVTRGRSRDRSGGDAGANGTVTHVACSGDVVAWSHQTTPNGTWWIVVRDGFGEGMTGSVNGLSSTIGAVALSRPAPSYLFWIEGTRLRRGPR